MILTSHRNGCAAAHAFGELDGCIKGAVLAHGGVFAEKFVAARIPRADGQCFTDGHFHLTIGPIAHVPFQAHNIARLINEAIRKQMRFARFSVTPTVVHIKRPKRNFRKIKIHLNRVMIFPVRDRKPTRVTTVSF